MPLVEELDTIANNSASPPTLSPCAQPKGSSPSPSQSTIAQALMAADISTRRVLGQAVKACPARSRQAFAEALNTVRKEILALENVEAELAKLATGSREELEECLVAQFKTQITCVESKCLLASETQLT